MIKSPSAASIKEKTKARQEQEVSYHEDKITRKTYLPAVSVGDKSNRISSAKYMRMPALEIDPARCKPWKYHNRDIAWLNRDRCADLITSVSSIGQREPGLVRAIDKNIDPDPDHDFEIIYGVRRWYSCSQIEGKKFLAIITEDDDKKCMVYMHSENADSQDITEFERAYSFKIQLESGVFSGQKEMAEEFGISQGLVSRMVTAASIFDYEFIRRLFPSKLDISIRYAHKLSQSLKNDLKAIEKRAEDVIGCKEELSISDKFKILLNEKCASSVERILLGSKYNKILSCVEGPNGDFVIKCKNLRAQDKEKVINSLSYFLNEVIV